MDNRTPGLKVSDSEMQYFQFKARQMFLLQKEDYDWQQFCLQKVSKCTTCQSECSSASKDIGVQTMIQKTPFNIGKKPSSESKLLSVQLPVELNFIKSKLEQIDETLSKLKVSTDDRTDKKTKPEMLRRSPINFEVSSLSHLEVRRKQFIQNSLRASLERLQASTIGIPSVSKSKIQPKNLGYFLPYTLQAQREAARRAYLSSLSNPRLINMVGKSQKKSSTTEMHSKLPNFATASVKKPTKNFQRKRALKHQGPAKSKKNIDVSTQVEDTIDRSTEGETFVKQPISPFKDENIELAVDGILNDLLGETVISLNAIKHRKAKQVLSKTFDKESMFQKPVKANEEISPVHSCSNFAEATFGSERERNMLAKDDHLIPELKISPKKAVDAHQSNIEEQTIPKTLRISLESSRKIAKYRKKFWKYLEATSWTANENFNPWVLADLIAEAIFDDCVTDVCQDIGELPSVLIDELYNQEFVQHM